MTPAERDYILDALPLVQRPYAAAWFALCHVLGASPSATFGRYSWWMNFNRKTPRWFDSMASMKPVNWEGLMADTRLWHPKKIETLTPVGG